MSTTYFHCHHCGAAIEVAPIFAEHPKGVRHEATAVFSFEKGETGKRRLRKAQAGEAGGCRILYNDEEYANPTAAGRKIAGYEVNGWVFWKYDSPHGVITLDELARGL